MNTKALIPSILSLGLLFQLGGIRTSNAEVIVAATDNSVLIQDGEVIVDANGKRGLSVIDLSGPEPVLKASIPLANSLFGPPVNVGITPDERLALIAEAMRPGKGEKRTELVPSNLVHVVNLTTNPPREIAQITVGRQPSGLSIHPKGHMALVANTADNFITILSINRDKVSVSGKVDISGPATHVAIAPDGRSALATMQDDHKVAVLKIDGNTVTNTEQDVPVGLYPFNLDITPNGALAIVNNSGKGGRSDGNANTVTILDLEHDPVHVIDHVTVGDSPEGIAISPTGQIAVVGLLDGGDGPYDAFYYHQRGRIVILGIDGKKVSRLQEITLGGLPEAIAFSPDGQLLLVGNLFDKNIAVLEVNGTEVVDTGRRISLPGQPAALRARPR
ncbi:lactonase family protein [uncultured Psychrobacter sp.]|uniref:lactonase family protein n=1 Tax=uncultured Psychrobacter sp. TaxID=259303 RepID=UPI0034573BEA